MFSQTHLSLSRAPHTGCQIGTRSSQRLEPALCSHSTGNTHDHSAQRAHRSQIRLSRHCALCTIWTGKPAGLQSAFSEKLHPCSSAPSTHTQTKKIRRTTGHPSIQNDGRLGPYRQTNRRSGRLIIITTHAWSHRMSWLSWVGWKAEGKPSVWCTAH